MGWGANLPHPQLNDISDSNLQEYNAGGFGLNEPDPDTFYTDGEKGSID
ncbi:MAG: hypothetical protein AB2598_10700 [Candidatus Thiodiazotropha sp.]